MPRRKVTMGLIPNRRLRANTFAKRKEGLKKKLRELSTLCGVRVALVCAAADGNGAGGGGAAEVWESSAGVLDAYRELPPEERARHTHRAYAEVELRKAEAKLVKVRQEGPAALAPWDAAVYALAPDEAQRLLVAVDEALQAVRDRRAAVGLPVEDGGVDGWPNGFAAAPGASDVIVPLGLGDPSTFPGSDDLVSMNGYLLRAHGNNANEQLVMWGNGFDPCSAAVNWQPDYAFQQCTADMNAYKLQMAAADMYGNNNSSSMGRLPWDAFHQTTNAVAMQHAGYGFKCTNGTGNSYVGGMPSYVTQQQMPSNAIVPLWYPLSVEMSVNYMDTPAAQATQQQQGIGGNYNAAAAALSLTMGTGDNFVNAQQAQPLAMSYSGDLVNTGDYVSQWTAGQ